MHFDDNNFFMKFHWHYISLPKKKFSENLNYVRNKIYWVVFARDFSQLWKSLKFNLQEIYLHQVFPFGKIVFWKSLWENFRNYGGMKLICLEEKISLN